MLSFSITTICLTLGLASRTYSHAFGETSIFEERDVALFGPFSRRNLENALVKRQTTGGVCGASKGGVSCGPGLCCSADGFCGTGGTFCTAPACQLQYGPACDGNKTPPGGIDTSKDPRPSMGNVPFGIEIKKCTVPGKIALTFDDGPYIYTPTLLDTLSKAGVKATFFVTGINGGKGEIDDAATGYPDLIRRMIKEGHQVASHTWSHQDLTTLTRQQRLDQMLKNEVALTKILGFFPTYMRPPYSFYNADVLADLKGLGYHVVNFDVDTNDWKGDYVAAKQNFINPVQAGSVSSSSFLVLMHDVHQQTVEDLVPYVLQQVSRLGYTPVTVGECLGDPAANWYRDPVKGTGIADTNVVVAKAASTTTKNATSVLPTASVSAAAFGVQSSGHANSSLVGANGTMVAAPSSKISSAAGPAASGSSTGGAVVVSASAMGVVSLLSVVAAFMSFL